MIRVFSPPALAEEAYINMRDINIPPGSFSLNDVTRGHKLSALATVLLLAACGGGGSSGGGSGGGMSGAPGATGAISFSGSAAVGTAIVNAPVTVKCAGSAQAVTTTSDLGRYSITMPASAKLPCVLRTAGPNGSLHAPVPVTWLGGEVNLTPLTDLVLTQAAGRLAESFFDTFTGSEVQLSSDASLNAAHKEVVDVFRALLNLSGMRNFVSEALVAAVAQRGQPGNQYDQMLDSLNAAMAAKGITYQRVAQALLAEKTGDKAALMLWGPNTAQGPVGVVPVTPPMSGPAPAPARMSPD